MTIVRSGARRQSKKYLPRRTGEDILSNEKDGWVGTTGGPGEKVGLEEIIGRTANQLESKKYQYSRDNPPIRTHYITNWITWCCFKRIYDYRRNVAELCDCLRDIIEDNPTTTYCPSACDSCSPPNDSFCHSSCCYINGHKRKRLGPLIGA